MSRRLIIQILRGNYSKGSVIENYCSTAVLNFMLCHYYRVTIYINSCRTFNKFINVDSGGEVRHIVYLTL